jgi:Domain of unknown function (DUF4111)
MSAIRLALAPGALHPLSAGRSLLLATRTGRRHRVSWRHRCALGPRLDIDHPRQGFGPFSSFPAASNNRLCGRANVAASPGNRPCGFAGIFTGATRLEPATSGVTGRRSRGHGRNPVAPQQPRGCQNTVQTATERQRTHRSWNIARLPQEHRAVLARARAIYLGSEDERWEDLESRVRPHVDYVVAEIERLATH